MKNKLTVDLFREITKSPGRFISIVFIVFLGTAFFSGLRSAGLDMKLSASRYYEDTKRMDACLLSTLGFTDKELSLIRETEGVSLAIGAKTKDVLINTSDNELLVKFIEYTPDINLPYLVSGKLPTKSNEALIDQKLFIKEGYRLGDYFSIKSGLKDLNIREIKIVGVSNLPYFLENDRGNSKLSNGSIDAFFILPKEAFKLDIFTEVYLKFEGTKNLMQYSKAYKDATLPILKRLEDLESTLAKSRYDKIVSEANAKIIENEKKVVDGEKKLSAAKNKLDKGEEKLKSERDKFESKKKQFEESGLLTFILPELTLADKKLQAEEKKLSESKKEFKKKEKEERTKILDANKKLKKAKKDIEELEFPEIYTLGSDKMASYVIFEQNADRMDNIGNVFPVIFFLVAALVSLTAMTRMVDEGRINMGTLKALGFSEWSIMGKYLLYSLLATLTGGIFGVIIGGRYFPLLIIESYQTLFIGMPYVLTPLNIKESFLALFFALLSTGGATIFSAHKVLRETPASLMRPIPPKRGKRVLLEHLPFLWKRLSFSGKATIRNLIRYKKRFIMTVFGIGSCMGLLLVGFGLRDSINEIARKQYVNIFTYDARITLDSKANIKDKKLLSLLARNHPNIRSQKYIHYQSIGVEKNESKKQAFLFIPNGNEELSNYIIFRDFKTKQTLSLSDDGIFITEKLARILDLKVGDELTLDKDNGKKVEVKVVMIVENYINHFIFMSPSYYEKQFGSTPTFNNLFLSYSLEPPNEKVLAETFLSEKASSRIYFITELEEQIESMLSVLNLVILVLIVSAGLLAFVVLYNLNSINVLERKRELATLKVLGFYDGEVSSYVYRENIILTIFGIFFGIFFGVILHRFVVKTVEVDLMMFGRRISSSSFFLSILFTFLFSFLINFIMHFVLKRIDMIQSLKSVE